MPIGDYLHHRQRLTDAGYAVVHINLPGADSPVMSAREQRSRWLDAYDALDHELREARGHLSLTEQPPVMPPL